MAKLGDAFSGEERRKWVLRQLRPGTVIYLDVTFPERIKPKYLVVAHVDDDCCTFIVNSKTSDFIRHRPALTACQVTLDRSRHDFLRHDSVIACHQVLRFPTSSVVDALVDSTGRIKGALHKEVLAQIIAAVQRAPTLSATDQTVIVEALREILDRV